MNLAFRIVQISPDLSGFRGCIDGLVQVRLAESRFGRVSVSVWVGGFGGIVLVDPRYGGGPVVQASDVRQRVVAFVEFGAAAGAFGHTLAESVAADVAQVPVLLGAKVSTAGEGDGWG